MVYLSILHAKLHIFHRQGIHSRMNTTEIHPICLRRKPCVRALRETSLVLAIFLKFS